MQKSMSLTYEPASEPLHISGFSVADSWHGLGWQDEVRAAAFAGNAVTREWVAGSAFPSNLILLPANCSNLILEPHPRTSSWQDEVRAAAFAGKLQRFLAAVHSVPPCSFFFFLTLTPRVERYKRL